MQKEDNKTIQIGQLTSLLWTKAFFLWIFLDFQMATKLQEKIPVALRTYLKDTKFIQISQVYISFRTNPNF